MAIVRLGGSGINLPTFPGLVTNTTGSNAGTTQGYTNVVTLGAGETFPIPAGTYWVSPGPYTFLQWLDPVSNIYRTRPTSATGTQFVNSDGANWRLANTTGCPIGAAITSGICTGSTNGIGSAINGVTCTASSGSSVWQTIIGGAIGATIATATTTAATTVGAGYLYIPTVVIDAPPVGGLQASAIVTALSSGTINSTAIQIINQGAGYASAPKMTFLPDARDTGPTTPAVYVTTLTATGQLTGCYPTNHGVALAGVPTLSFGIGSCQATAIMNFTVTAYALTSTTGAGAGLPANTELISTNHLVAAQTNPTVNPLHATGLTFPRPARIYAPTSGGAVPASATGVVIEDGGLGIQVVPSIVCASVPVTSGNAPAFAAPTVGGTTDTSLVQPI